MPAPIRSNLRPEGLLGKLAAPSADRDYRPGHARVLALLAPLKLPRPRLRIRIAGTNGKGSTAWFIATALQAAGLQTGLFSSPHLVSFAERIRIGLAPAPESLLLDGLAVLAPIAERVKPSWFELATALALWCFAQQRVEVEVLEAGVGARLDATTAVPAEAAALAPVARDHEAWLGRDLAAIAREKAFVFAGTKVQASAPQAPPVRRVLAELGFSPRIARPWQGELAARGAHQRINAGLAWAVLEGLGKAGMIPWQEQRMRAAIAAATPPGRLVRVSVGDGELWLDPAHNAHAAKALARFGRSIGGWQLVVLATRADRDPAPLARALARVAMRVQVLDAPDKAAQVALAAAKEGARVLLAGSHLTVGAALARLESPCAA